MFWETCLTQGRVDAYRGAGLWQDRLLWDCFSETVDAEPHKTAVVDSTTRLTYQQVAELAERCALGLLRIGIRSGDVVTVQLPNRYEHLVITLAVELIGAVVNPVPTILRKRELSLIAQLSRSKVLVIQARHRNVDHLDLARQVQMISPDLRHIVLLGADQATPGVLLWDQLLSEYPHSHQDRQLLKYIRRDANDVCLLAFTSGTTGMPKGVMHTNNTLVSNAQAVSRARHYGRDLVIYMLYQLGHLAGHLWGIRMPLQVGGTIVLREEYQPGEALSIIETEQVNMLWGSDVNLIDLLSSDSFRSEALESLRLVSALGEALSPVWGEKALGYVKLASGFGMTEMGIATSTVPGSSKREMLETDGKPLPGVELRIVNDDGSDLPVKTTGRLLIRSPYNFIGYSQGRAFTGKYLTEEGWFDTEDLASVDTDGSMKWRGRVKDVIRRGGVSVPAREIEELIRQHAAIAEVAVVAVQDPRFGERACACVVMKPNFDVDLDDIKRLLEQQGVTKQYWPEYIERFDELPRSVLGKVAKAELKSEAERRLSGRVSSGTSQGSSN